MCVSDHQTHTYTPAQSEADMDPDKHKHTTFHSALALALVTDRQTDADTGRQTDRHAVNRPQKTIITKSTGYARICQIRHVTSVAEDWC